MAECSKSNHGDAESLAKSQHACSQNYRRLPQAWIDILSRKIEPTGKWSDYNEHYRWAELLCGLANDGHGLLCSTDVPPFPDVDDYPDLES